MGKLTRKEVSILVTFACAVVVMALAVADFARGGNMTMEYVETSLLLAVLARVM
ncbi:MAG: hypothetical protein IJG82_09175 [Atopobiaceae bacterium]|nr:hypothetical protein [Atopobiaceae bacterium]